MNHPEEEMILNHDEDKNDGFIDEQEVQCEGVRKSSRDSIPVDRIEPQWYNEKYYLELRKEKKVTFEGAMPNMKTNMNHNLLTQTI